MSSCTNDHMAQVPRHTPSAPSTRWAAERRKEEKKMSSEEKAEAVTQVVDSWLPRGRRVVIWWSSHGYHVVIA